MIGSRRPLARLVGSAFVVILALAPAARAGVNTWTGARPAEAVPNHQVLMATDPRDPYVVYAVFQPSIYKSRDGGRTWTHLASFVHIDALLVHPAAPDTLYAAATHGLTGEYAGVLKSEDGGVTWVFKPYGLTQNYWPTRALAGSPTDANTVYAGGQSSLFKSTNGGDSWNMNASLAGEIASLIVSPRDTQLVYVGSESTYSYYYYPYPFGAFARSADSGETFEVTMSEVGRVGAIAVDPDVDSRVFVGLGGDPASGDTGVRRSDDGGLTFSRANNGLPTGAGVSSLILDPSHPSTLYAGTDAGLFRSRDSGANWSAIGQVLSGQLVSSLAISSDGRRIHAGTLFNAFHLDLVSGPVDIAATPDGGARVLRWDSDADRLAVQTVDGSNNWTATPFSATSQTWSGIAIASAGDGAAQVLWQNGDGRSSLEALTASGESTSTVYGSSNGIPADVAVGADGRIRLLWTDAAGAMHIETVGADGSVGQGPTYGPTPGWSAVAVDVDAQGRAWVLWRSADGRAAVSLHVDGTLVTTVKWGATEGWWVEDLGVGSDGRARVLARNVAGAMQVWTVAEDGSRSVGSTNETPGLVPRRIAGGSDGLTRVLWGGEHGEGEVWFLDSGGNHVAVAVPVPP